MKVEIGPYGKSRKVEIQIDKWDTWNMDHTLALIIHPMLIQLRDTNHGYPSELTNEEWIEIQNKMIWSFEQIINDGQWDLSPEYYKEHQNKVQEGLDLFGKYFRSLWD